MLNDVCYDIYNLVVKYSKIYYKEKIDMEKKQYNFSCSGDIEDLNDLHQLFVINGINSMMQEIPIDDGEMGLEEILIAVISSTVIPSVLDSISEWFPKGRKKIKIVDKNTGKEIYLESNDGKGFSGSEMEKILSFFEKQD